jgi:hypothetical protein
VLVIWLIKAEASGLPFPPTPKEWGRMERMANYFSDYFHFYFIGVMPWVMGGFSFRE